MEIRIKNIGNQPLPKYQTLQSAGVDIHAFCNEQIVLKSLERQLIATGLYIELPIGYEAQIRPRSGMALKHGITVLNTPGTIDSDYRGEIKVLLVNLSNEEVTIHPGDRIAQMVIAKHEQASFVLTSELSNTERGEGGYGHTGINKTNTNSN